MHNCTSEKNIHIDAEKHFFKVQVLFKCTIAHLQRNISLDWKCCVYAHLQKTFTDSFWDRAHLRFIHFIHQPHNHHSHNHHVWCMEYTHRDKYMFIHKYVGLLCSKYQPDSQVLCKCTSAKNLSETELTFASSTSYISCSLCIVSYHSHYHRHQPHRHHASHPHHNHPHHHPHNHHAHPIIIFALL